MVEGYKRAIDEIRGSIAKTDFRAKIRPGVRKTARRAAERPPNEKLKLSRVTSGYGGLKIPHCLGQICLTQKINLHMKI